MMNMNCFIKQFSDLLEINIDEIPINFNLNQLHSWDSISVLSTIALIDDCFQVSISGDEIEKCNTLDNIVQLIKQKTNG